jgi:hypothetical protein
MSKSTSPPMWVKPGTPSPEFPRGVNEDGPFCNRLRRQTEQRGPGEEPRGAVDDRCVRLSDSPHGDYSSDPLLSPFRRWEGQNAK